MLAYFHRQGNFLCLDQHFSLSQLPLFREIHVKSDLKCHVPQAKSADLIVIYLGLEIGLSLKGRLKEKAQTQP